MLLPAVLLPRYQRGDSARFSKSCSSAVLRVDLPRLHPSLERCRWISVTFYGGLHHLYFKHYLRCCFYSILLRLLVPTSLQSFQVIAHISHTLRIDSFTEQSSSTWELLWLQWHRLWPNLTSIYFSSRYLWFANSFVKQVWSNRPWFYSTPNQECSNRQYLIYWIDFQSRRVKDVWSLQTSQVQWKL